MRTKNQPTVLRDGTAAARLLRPTLKLVVPGILLLLLLCSSVVVGETVSIPASLAVTIQPAEAVADGATWSADGGVAHRSGDVDLDVLAGIHAVAFADLPGWVEPGSLEVQVVGGKAATLVATFTPVPRVYFRSVPPQRARGGQPLELILVTEDPGDPLAPGPGTPLELQATPMPAGPLVYDPATGHLRYTAVPADRLPFTVSLSTPVGLSGSFEVTPVNPLGVDEQVIEYDRPLPDAESRDYMTLTQTRNPPAVFNNFTNETYTVTLSGQTLVFAEGHPASLLRQFGGRIDVRELHLFADRVIVRSPLLLPAAHVTIHARELRFEGEGCIDTTPKPRTRVPLDAVWEDNLFVGSNGDPGNDGGDVDILVERFFSDPTTRVRLVMQGGDGVRAGDGRDGRDEATIGAGTPDWLKLMGRAGNSVCDFTEDGAVVLYEEDIFNNRPTETCGDPVTPRGENAVRSGVPGAGGRGGALRSTLDLTAFTHNPGGAAGAKGRDHAGGHLLPTRRFVYRTVLTFTHNGIEHVNVDDEDAPPAVPGDSAPAPSAAAGAPGGFLLQTNAGSWLHPFGVRSVVQFARDAYLNGRIEETRRLMGDYQQILRAHARNVAPGEELSDEEFSERVNLDQLLVEVDNVVHRIDSNLDYFGNPAGWVPMLSFEANLLAFQNEIDQSIPVLYLAYWLNNAATNLQASLAATEQAHESLEEERVRMESEFNEAQAAIPGLKTQAASIAAQIGALQDRLSARLGELQQRAHDNVEERHKVPLWKEGLGVLAVAADLIPVGQPLLGRVGAGLGLLGQLDTDKPLESAKAIIPHASSVMTNVDISVCFGTNGPPDTSGSKTNATRKATQDRIKQLTECGKFLSGEFNEIKGVFKDVQVDDKELAAELDKLKASDSEFQSFTDQLGPLNAQKAAFAQQLAASLQVVGSYTSRLAQNLVAGHELEDRIAAHLSVLDHTALLHIKEMQRRAGDRLLQYQYYLAKSFQYRRLRPYTGNLQLQRLFTRFQQLIEANTSHVLSQQDFATLKTLFTDELREIVAQSLDNVNAPSRSFPKSYRLSASQRQQLNDEGRLVLNLPQLGLIDTGDENVRIADLRVRTLVAHPVGGQPGSLALVRVNFEHRGLSRLTSQGRTFLFRHYQTEAVNPIV
jgi:hypothetical protein